MNYKLEFLSSAYKEWKKLDRSLQLQFKKKLAERVKEPRIAKDCLRGDTDLYKIKLRTAGYRLVCKVFDKKITIVVIAIGKRNRKVIYQLAAKRL